MAAAQFRLCPSILSRVTEAINMSDSLHAVYGDI